MSFFDVVSGWLPLIGGLSGLLLLVYMLWMGYYARKKDRDLAEFRVENARSLGELKGRLDALLLLERRR